MIIIQLFIKQRAHWVHLFRERKGGDGAKKLGSTIQSVFEVKDVLDLEREETAYRYVKRSVAKTLSAQFANFPLFYLFTYSEKERINYR